MPVGDALECIAGGDQPRFVEVPADELEGDRPAVRREAAGQRDGRAAGHVERTGEAQQPADQRGVLAERRHLGERRRGEGLGRHGDQIDRLEQRPHRAAERFAAQHDLLIVDAGLLQAEIEQPGEPGAVLVLARRIGRLVRDGGLDAAQRKPVVDHRLRRPGT